MLFQSYRSRRLYQISRQTGRTAVGAVPRRTRRRDEILQGDLRHGPRDRGRDGAAADRRADLVLVGSGDFEHDPRDGGHGQVRRGRFRALLRADRGALFRQRAVPSRGAFLRSEAHTSELQSLMRISYDVFRLKKKKYTIT